MTLNAGKPDRKTFWQLTLEQFGDKPVRVTVRSGAFMVGQLQDVGPVACRLITTDPTPSSTILLYEQLRGCEAVA